MYSTPLGIQLIRTIEKINHIEYLNKNTSDLFRKISFFFELWKLNNELDKITKHFYTWCSCEERVIFKMCAPCIPDEESYYLLINELKQMVKQQKEIRKHEKYFGNYE